MSSQNSPARGHRPVFSDWRSVARVIEHTLLRPDATPDQVVRLCEEAREYGFGVAMVNPCYVDLARSSLDGNGTKVGAVIGFPLGATLTSVKQFEAIEVIERGAQEIDMVINIGELKGGNREYVRSDIRAVADAAHAKDALLKVIIETILLSDDEKRLACELSESAGADFVKTSTGFLGGGATVADVALMRRTVKIGVKASGGIRIAADAKAMIEAGADRLGTSSGVQIIAEIRGQTRQAPSAPHAKES
jgi:deoxyribose-phosphate aldolase